MTNVLPFRAPLRASAAANDARAMRSPLLQQFVTRDFNREWSAYLEHPSEFRVLSHILDQTVSAGRLEWGFTYKKLEDGDGNTKGTRYSRSTLIRAVAKLARLGFITKQPNAKGINIVINPVWTPGPDTLPVSKTMKGRRASVGPDIDDRSGGVIGDTPWPQRGVMGDTPGVSPMTPIREEAGREEAKGQVEARSVDDARSRGRSTTRSDEISSPVPVRMRQRPSARSLSAKEENPPVAPAPLSPVAERSTLTAQAIERTMRRAIEKTYPEAPAIPRWTDQECSLVLEGWTAPPEAAHEFFEWIVATWAELGRTYEMPRYPDAAFVIKYQGWLQTTFSTTFIACDSETGFTEPR